MILSSSAVALQEDVGRMVMQPLRSQFLHLAPKLALACCLSISTSSARLTPTSLGSVSLHAVHLMLRSQMQSFGTSTHSTFSVRANSTKLNMGITCRILQIQTQMQMQQTPCNTFLFSYAFEALFAEQASDHIRSKVIVIIAFYEFVQLY